MYQHCPTLSYRDAMSDDERMPTCAFILDADEWTYLELRNTDAALFTLTHRKPIWLEEFAQGDRTLYRVNGGNGAVAFEIVDGGYEFWVDFATGCVKASPEAYLPY